METLDILVPVFTALIGAIVGGGVIWGWLGKGLRDLREGQRKQNHALRWLLLWVNEDMRASEINHPEFKRASLDPMEVINMLDLG